MQSEKDWNRLTDLIAKHRSNVLLISEMESDLIEFSDSEIKELQAIQAMTSRDLDERNKLSN